MPSRRMSGKSLEAGGELWLGRGGENLLGEARFALLDAIDRTGSITRAGKEAGISYRTAWDTVDRLNALSDKPWVVAAAGGRSGGGTRLTPFGRDMLAMYTAFREEHAKFLAGLGRSLGDVERFRRLARKTSLKVSARNQIWGVVDAVRFQGLSAEVVLRTRGKGRLRAAITRAGLESMELRNGDEAYALIKANWITLAADPAPSPSPPRLRPRERAAEAGKRPRGPGARDAGEGLDADAAGINRWPGSIVGLSRAGSEAEILFQSRDGIPLVIHQGGGTVHPALAEGIPAQALFRPEDVILGVAP